MSTKPLSDEQLEEYKKILVADRNKSLKIIKEITDFMKEGFAESSGDLGSYSIHQADNSSSVEYYNKQIYLLEKQQEKLKRINQSLEQIYDKTYGICQLCGKYIQPTRLRIIPFAKYCIECKTKEEKRHNSI